ncbi:LOW QUALITY PROTEIN: hypothetical protein Cgig2_021728 [Carnegiea gigantea]|uniref:DUF4283 domain-containing protein n=1 Tax=Carnegiea gigantea TaxID=171969 RepID=A0A9Q1Q5Z1_9CARY|nr:LOW QUALITY PROTEIN: hypothetical protein Cgig2_021728 [Carnegiea gigantea]
MYIYIYTSSSSGNSWETRACPWQGVEEGADRINHSLGAEVDAKRIPDQSTPNSVPSGNGTIPLNPSPEVVIALSRGTAPVINGVKYAKTGKNDVLSKIVYGQATVLCSVLGANLRMEVIEGYLRRVWKSLDIDEICFVRKGVYIVCFNSLDDQLTVVQKGVYYFDNKPLLVKPWNQEMDINTEAITSLPIWVKLLDLDIKYWGMAGLSKLGSASGIPIKTDKFTMELNYARLLIDILVEGAFPEFIHFVNDHDVVVQADLLRDERCTQPQGEVNDTRNQCQGTDTENFITEDIKIFLQERNIGVIGLLETKFKEKNVEMAATKLFQGWYWQHNFHLNTKGRIWIAWRPRQYNV